MFQVLMWNPCSERYTYLGWTDFDTLVSLKQRNNDIHIGDMEISFAQLVEEYELDCIFFGETITWTLEDIVEDYREQCLTLLRLGFDIHHPDEEINRVLRDHARSEST